MSIPKLTIRGHRNWCDYILTDRDGVERKPCDCGEDAPEPNPEDCATLAEQLFYTTVNVLLKSNADLKQRVRVLEQRVDRLDALEKKIKNLEHMLPV